MKPEDLQEADGRGKNQCCREGERQGTVVDMPFVFIVRPKKAQQEQDGRRRSHDTQSEEGRVER